VKYRVSKNFRFEAAHRLLNNYEGKCTNNHGHSWTVKLFIDSATLDNKDMVIDFNEMKLLGKWIDDNLDHATLLWKNDPLANILIELKQRVFLTEKNPTSEHIAEVILQKSCDLFKDKPVAIAGIEISETCTASASIFL